MQGSSQVIGGTGCLQESRNECAELLFIGPKKISHLTPSLSKGATCNIILLVFPGQALLNRKPSQRVVLAGCIKAFLLSHRHALRGHGTLV